MNLIRISRWLSALLVLGGAPAFAQSPSAGSAGAAPASVLTAAAPFERPLGEVLAEIGDRFGVRIVCKRFDADTVRVRWAPFRVRPYSLDETLDRLLQPLDLVWKAGKRIEVQPYEYYRRTVADGERLLAWLSEQAPDRAAWEQRRRQIVADVRTALVLDPFLRAVPAERAAIVGRETQRDGYTMQNFALESLPGLYVCGTVYAPAGSRGGKRGRHPLVVAPSGHWPEARYRADHQLLMSTLARMGAVAVDMDIVGWGESERQIGIEAHTAPYAMQLQVLWSKLVTDWIVDTRNDIDTARMAATGGSGGATHALLLAAVDDRFAALAPVVHLVSHFDGGCPCESGRPVTLAAGGSCTTEILAAVMAPKPVLTVSDGGDWTASYPTLEYPWLQRIWDFYGARDRVHNAHFAAERHDFGPSKRQAVYAFVAETFGLPADRAVESDRAVLPAEAMQSFAGRDLPDGAVRSREELERMIEKLK